MCALSMLSSIYLAQYETVDLGQDTYCGLPLY